MEAPKGIDRVHVEQVRAIYAGAMPGQLASVVTGFILAAVLVRAGSLSWAAAAPFLIPLVASAAFRLVLLKMYRRADRRADWRRWALWLGISAATGGLTWGIGAVWLMPDGRFGLQLLVISVITAMASGAMSAFGGYLPVYVCNVVPMMVPSSVWIALRGDALHLGLSAMMVLWIVAILVLARQYNANLLQSLRLRFENIDLVDDLRRQKELAEQANIAKSRFLAAASHDLRQPVHALGMFIGALRGRSMDEEARRLVEHIGSSVSAMDGLFTSLLDISRLDAGVIQSRLAAFPIHPLLERICRDQVQESDRKGIRLTLRASTAHVASDPVLLERILRNIVSNAVRYTGRGRILIACRRRGARLSIGVWDTGRGIPASERENIFQEFYQLENAERDRSKGLGLGLAIVKRLTALLDHPLTFRSVPGRGSAFFVSVPLARDGDPVAAFNAEEDDRASGSSFILVIDDEIAIQEAMRSLLASWGHRVVVAGSVEEMMERLAESPSRPDLIITDYRLRGDTNGVAAIHQLQAEYNADIPAVLMTGDTAPDRLKEAQASGFLLLHKPVASGKLRAAIGNLTRAGGAIPE